jgi:peptide-methionine (S)-S-oxide reductase
MPFKGDSFSQQGIFGALAILKDMKRLQKRILTVLALFSIGFLFQFMTAADLDPSAEKASASDSIVLGGGCFWCVEALYETLDGVQSVESGYAGGHDPNPTYREVCSGSTGHAEVVKVSFVPETISLDKLLAFFWEAHDPTTLNRQGADVGTQYRSIILYNSEEQKAAAEASKQAAQQAFSKPIVTEIAELTTFHKAENYHQDYFKNNQDAPYCQYVIAPKLKKLDP